MEWQPIATAPQDGKPFLCWNGEEMMVLNQPKDCALGTWHLISGKWCGHIVRFNHPTHWRPLLLPPKKGK